MKSWKRFFGLMIGTFISMQLVATCTAQESESPRREVYKYIWDFVIMGDGEATAEDLKSISSYFSSFDEETQTKIKGNYASKTLSEHQKREAIREHMQNAVYGTVTTKSGNTYKGILVFQTYRDSRRIPLYGFNLTLTSGGITNLPWHEIVEIQSEGEGSYWSDYTYMVKNIKGKVLSGKSTGSNYVMVFQKETTPIETSFMEVKRIVFGGLKAIECPDCFRVMEIDWKYCPYCRTELQKASKEALEK